MTAQMSLFGKLASAAKIFVLGIVYVGVLSASTLAKELKGLFTHTSTGDRVETDTHKPVTRDQQPR